MTLFDDESSKLPDQLPAPDSREHQPAPAPSPPNLLPEPLTYTPVMLPPSSAIPVFVPPDLRISWSWPHFIVFCALFVGGMLFIPLFFFTYLTSVRHMAMAAAEKLLTTNAQYAVAMQLVWSALMLLFLYVTLAALPERPFWATIGWHRFEPSATPASSRAWRYFFLGGGLAIFVALASSAVSPRERLPIQELLKDAHSAFLFTALAVIVAPFIEETLFRGYLYPFFAAKFTVLAHLLGRDPSQALRIGTRGGILLTGVLFGSMHGAQLGWTWSLVALLSFVGIVLTYVRARTGTVLASYLLHLGYNSAIAITTLIGTRGFTHWPSPR